MRAGLSHLAGDQRLLPTKEAPDGCNFIGGERGPTHRRPRQTRFRATNMQPRSRAVCSKTGATKRGFRHRGPCDNSLVCRSLHSAAEPLGGPPAPLPSGNVTELTMPLSGSLLKEGTFNLGPGAGKDRKILFPELFCSKSSEKMELAFLRRSAEHRVPPCRGDCDGSGVLTCWKRPTLNERALEL